jgi:hypothetical protein
LITINDSLTHSYLDSNNTAVPEQLINTVSLIRGIYIEICSRNERNGLIWMEAGVWKLTAIRRGLAKGTYLLCRSN